jgi:serine O-acetyltransferase
MDKRSSEKKENLCEGDAPKGGNSYKRLLPDIIDKVVKDLQDEPAATHLNSSPIPSRDEIFVLMRRIQDILFPGFFGNQKMDSEVLSYHIGKEITTVHEMLSAQISKAFIHECQRLGKACTTCAEQGESLSVELLKRLPKVRRMLIGDVKAAFRNDPAAKTYDEIIFCYPCIKAITHQRVAHELWGLGVPLLPRIITELAHTETGIDIHPGAKIGHNFFIDHGTGTVIGETTEIGNNVVLYQHVTLGALNFPRDEEGVVIKTRKRHPTVGNNVVIYAGATILGGETRIGNNVVVAGNSWVTCSIPDNTKAVTECPALKLMSHQETKKGK